MAFDERLADRVRATLHGRRQVSERRMFGGLAFFVRGHTCCGVVGDELMVRVGPERYDRTLRLAHAREMDFTGRPLRGYVYVARAGLRTSRQLRVWVDRGVAFARSLPPRS